MRIIKIISLIILLVIIISLPVLAEESQYNTMPGYQEVIMPIGADYFIINGVEWAVKHPVYLSDEGVTMVPVRMLLHDIYGFYSYDEIIWNPLDISVTIVMYGEREITFIAGKSFYIINDDYEIPYRKGTSEIVDGVFYVPARDLGDSYGLPISWDAETNSTIINRTHNSVKPFWGVQ